MLAPIRASDAAMANHAHAYHTKQKAWRSENAYYVFARGQVVCDLRIVYANVFDVGVKLSEAQSFRGFDNPLKDRKMGSIVGDDKTTKTSAE